MEQFSVFLLCKKLLHCQQIIPKNIFGKCIFPVLRFNDYECPGYTCSDTCWTQTLSSDQHDQRRCVDSLWKNHRDCKLIPEWRLMVSFCHRGGGQVYINANNYTYQADPHKAVTCVETKASSFPFLRKAIELQQSMSLCFFWEEAILTLETHVHFPVQTQGRFGEGCFHSERGSLPQRNGNQLKAVRRKSLDCGPHSSCPRLLLAQCQSQLFALNRKSRDSTEVLIFKTRATRRSPSWF